MIVIWCALAFSYGVFDDTPARGLLVIELALPFTMAIAVGVIVYLFTRKLADDVLDPKTFVPGFKLAHHSTISWLLRKTIPSRASSIFKRDACASTLVIGIPANAILGSTRTKLHILSRGA